MAALKLNNYEPNEVVKGNKYNADLKEIQTTLNSILSFTGIGDISFKKDYLAMVSTPFISAGGSFSDISFSVKLDTYNNIEQIDSFTFKIINNSLNVQTFTFTGTTTTTSYFNTSDSLVIRIYDKTNDTTLIEFPQGSINIDVDGNFEISNTTLVFNVETLYSIQIRSVVGYTDAFNMDINKTFFHISGSELSDFSIKTSNIEYDGDTLPNTNLNSELTTIKENINDVIQFRGNVYAFSNSNIEPPFAYGTWTYIGNVPEDGTFLGGGEEGTISNGAVIDHNHTTFDGMLYETGGGSSSGGLAGIATIYGFNYDGASKIIAFGGSGSQDTDSFYTSKPLPGTDTTNEWPANQEPNDKNRPYGIYLGIIHIWKRVS